MINQAERSKILLVCLGSEKEKEQLQKVSARTLFKVFRPFGHLNKVLLFSRSPFVKAFVEFRELDDADTARALVHSTPVDDFGLARLFPSKLDSLNCTNKFIDVLEVSPADDLKIFNDLATAHSTSSPAQPQGSGRRLPLFEETPPTTPAYTKTTQFDFNDEPSTAHKTVQVQSAKVLRREEPGSGLARKTSFATGLSAPQAKGGEEAEAAALSPVLLFSNVDAGFASSRELFSLFSCFGNLNKVLYMKNLRKVLLEYERVEFAQNCLIYMHNRPVGKSKLKANFSKFQSINLKKNNKSAASQQFNDLTRGTKETNRFAAEGLVRVTPPSATLLFACRQQDYISPADLAALAEPFYKPLRVRLAAPEEADLLDGRPVGPALLRVELDFANIKDAAFVLAKCHNTILKSEKLSVSFCPVTPVN